MSQSQMSHCHLLPMRLIGLLYPTIAIPAGDDFAEACLATEASLQGTQIVHREAGESWSKME